MAKRDILNSLEYRRIKDTYNGVLFADNSGDKLNKSPIIYNGDGIIMPFSFSTNAGCKINERRLCFCYFTYRKKQRYNALG